MSVNVVEFAKETIKELGGEVDAIAIFCNNKGKSVAGFAGVDSLGISPTTVLLIDSITRAVDERFGLAKMLCEKFREDGLLDSKIVRSRTENLPHDDQRTEPLTDDEAAECLFELLTKGLNSKSVLNGLMKKIEEEVHNAHDD